MRTGLALIPQRGVGAIASGFTSRHAAGITSRSNGERTQMISHSLRSEMRPFSHCSDSVEPATIGTFDSQQVREQDEAHIDH